MNYALLWSQRQNALHVEPVDAMLEKNMRAYRDDRPTGYSLLLIGDKELVENTASALRGTIEMRAAQRRANTLAQALADAR